MLSSRAAPILPCNKRRDSTNHLGARIIITTWLCSLLFMLLCFFVYRYMDKGSGLRRRNASEHRLLLSAILAAGFIIRVVIAWHVYGYDVDVNTFKAWAAHAASAGLAGFYTEDMFADYPPGYIYVLYVIGWLREHLNMPFDDPAFLLLLKSPAIAADMLGSYLLYRLAIRYTGNLAAAAGSAALYLLNPAVIADSAAWGQVDSFFMLWVLLLFEALSQGKLRPAAVLYAVALLIKPQALLFGPLLLFIFVRRRSWRELAVCLGLGLGAVVLLAAPFLIHKGPFWLFSLYFGTLSSYPYASLNAYNLMALLGGNFAPVAEKMLLLSYQTWSALLMACLLVFAAFLYFKSKRDESQLAVIGALLMAGAFTVLTKMHERYLFYALPLLLYGFIRSKDRRLLLLFIGFSVTHYINVGQVLTASFRQEYHIAPGDAVLRAVSLTNVILFAFLCVTAWLLIVRQSTVMLAGGTAREDGGGADRRGKASDEGRSAARLASLESNAQLSAAAEDTERSGLLKLLPRVYPLNWGRKDTLLLGALVLAYSVLAFYHLGSTEAPETGWQATEAGERIVIDLGEKRPIERINSFEGIGDGSFTYEISEDGLAWTEPVEVSADVFKVLMWQVIPVNETGQYIRLTVKQPTFTLNEIAVYAEGSRQPAPIRSVQGERVNPATAEAVARLADEQSKAAYTPTYMNGAYFDEIYHARTAYEHLHKIEPYESTHPPLGKLFISLGIALFGMNPFGWRIVGTMLGIAMLPIMYVFGKRLFGRSEYAFVCSFLMAADALHFVQTRIATIDVYGVFFILLMFYYMYRYCGESLLAESWTRSFIPLGLSGLFFGLGAASKWIALYAGAGLAVMFFLSLALHYREYRLAVRELAREPRTDAQRAARLKAIADVFPFRALMTLLFCCGFFVIIPAAIYVMSYIPFMMVPGPGHGLADVWTYQKNMFSYHSQLKATHPFSSEWWQWPIMARPVWYYGAAELPPGQISSIAAIGNPLVWWTGFAAIVLLLVRGLRTRCPKALFIVIAFFSQYVPWMLVPRLTFLYHYFAMVPFSILAIVYYYRHWKETNPASKRWLYLYLGAAAVGFALFYPVLSGLVVSRSYAEHVLKWFPQWQFF
ncbi:glycosyltransferase family 39 protein [Paenibacillus doosanensis]|uniref:glycosyltransferase family 39 protein n=1 Tax=Paenibacillus doosanensis TaxID=1229154 RepID=UPI00217F4B7D|nr:glycosyltransferase family 39 protein [Paenibacillus doosanensis]MCS7464353.1 glycosyltransferase family 39 protein [Paenibacillus doosanensis]